MHQVWVLLVLLLPAQPRVKPVAMVLEAGEGSTLRRGGQPQMLRDMDLLLPGDVVEAGGNGVLLVVLEDGHGERLAARQSGRPWQPAAAAPPEAVQEQIKSRLPEADLKRLRSLAQRGLAGMATLRDTSNPPPAVSPLDKSVVLSITVRR